MALLPDRDRGCEQSSALRGQAQSATAPVGGVFGDGDQAASLEWFKRGGEGGAIHCEESCDRGYARWLRAVERHHEGELAVGQAYGAQRLIEAASQSARCPLDMKTETTVANAQGSFERD